MVMNHTAHSRRRTAIAASAVFATPELLEAILLRLPHNALLRAQRVCRQWNHTIRQSVKAQQKLFKSSSQPTSAATETGTFDYKGMYLQNNKYKEDFDVRPPQYLTPNPINGPATNPRRYQLHPRFHYIFHIWIKRYGKPDLEPKHGWQDPWRSTLLLQPALHKDLLIEMSSNSAESNYWIVSGKNGAPITLGDFYDAMQADILIFE